MYHITVNQYITLKGIQIMTYNPKYNEQHYKYRSEKYKRVGFDVPKTYYDDVIKPAADARGIPVAKLIKQAIEAYIEE